MKKTINVLTSVILSLAIIFLAMAQVDISKSVHDLGGYLSPEEESTLEEKATALSGKYGVPVIVIITGDAQGKTSKQFLEDFYQNNNFATVEKQEGLVFLVDMDSRNIDLRVFGDLSDLISMREIDKVLDAALDKMVEEGSIYLTANEFLVRSDALMEPWLVRITTEPNTSSSASNTNGIQNNTNTQSYGDTKLTGSASVITSSFVIGFVLSYIIVILMYLVHKKTLPGSVSANNYMDKKKLKYSLKRDKFVDTITTKVRIRNHINSGNTFGGGLGGFNSSGGGRSFGGSSGGFSSSGGGRSFGGSRKF